MENGIAGILTGSTYICIGLFWIIVILVVIFIFKSLFGAIGGDTRDDDWE